MDECPPKWDASRRETALDETRAQENALTRQTSRRAGTRCALYRFALLGAIGIPFVACGGGIEQTSSRHEDRPKPTLPGTSPTAPAVTSSTPGTPYVPKVLPPSEDSDDLPTKSDKVDLLFVVDNSMSMADKQNVLGLGLPDLVERFVSPACVDDEGHVVEHPGDPEAECPDGSERQFASVDDLHVGVITTSLGGYGAVIDCVPAPNDPSSQQRADMAHLLGTLDRAADLAPEGFLTWSPGTDRSEFVSAFSELVTRAGEFGCGYESPLEAMVRFLVDPKPYTKLVRANCSFGNDQNQLCIGPETDGNGEPLVDEALLEQRRAFLRPDSLLTIVIFGDENDCSMKPTGQSWRLSQTQTPIVPGSDQSVANKAYKGSAACQTDPNGKCCVSCGTTTVPAGCPAGVDDEGRTVSEGCEVPRYASRDDLLQSGSSQPTDDPSNLRCFQQKRRFGVDYLLPVERYANALRVRELCTTTSDLDPASCDAEDRFENPVLAGRATSLVFLVGIVGVPWQDLAQSVDDDVLRYRNNRDDASNDEALKWNWLIGERNPEGGIAKPRDPLMLEQIEPRSGTNPATGEKLAPPTAGYGANSINGHEWNIEKRDNLQYACLFPLPEPRTCLEPEEEAARLAAGEAVPSCVCTDSDPSSQNPACQAEDGTYDRTQRFGPALPGLRQLQVLHDFGNNAVVASICPKQTDDETRPDFGYRPAMDAVLERLREGLFPE